MNFKLLGDEKDTNGQKEQKFFGGFRFNTNKKPFVSFALLSICILFIKKKSCKATWSVTCCLATLFYISRWDDVLLFLEEAVVETLEALSVTGLVLGHFMNGVMDSVEVELFGTTCDAHLILVGTGLGSHAALEVLLG